MIPEKEAFFMPQWLKKSKLRSGFVSALYWLTLILSLELVLHILAYGVPDGDFWMVVGFSTCGSPPAASFREEMDWEKRAFSPG